MKRTLLVTVLLSIILCAIGLSALSEGDLAFPSENLEAVSFKRLDSGASVSLGMSRADAELVLGAPINPESDGNPFATYEGGIQVGYRDGILCALRLYPKDALSSAYVFGKGIGYGTPIEEAIKQYEPYMFAENIFWEALLENRDGEWAFIRKEDFPGLAKANKNEYVIIDILGGAEGVTSAYIIDAYFAKHL